MNPFFIRLAKGVLFSLLLAGGALAEPKSPGSGALPRLTSPISNLTFVVFDTETTGFNASKDRIVEIGAIMVRNGQIIAERSWLMNPGRAIPKRAMDVHGITDAMVKDQPAFATVYTEFQAFVGDALLVAHNARFDVAMMRSEMDRAGIAPPPNAVIDSLKLFREWFPDASSHKLGDLAAQLGLAGDDFHRGEADSRYTALILFKGLDAHPKCDRLRELLSAAGGLLVF